MKGTDLSEALDVSPSMISRLRKGTRQPALPLMIRIEKALQWPVCDQVTAIREDRYATAFQEALSRDLESGGSTP